jgi:hypothetical protein
MQNDYRRWNDALFNAETLLPADNPDRARLAALRADLESLRRAYLRNGELPKPDAFITGTAEPLANISEELRKDIERRLRDKEFVRSDETQAPAQYADRVAEYFKALADQTGASPAATAANPDPRPAVPTAP